MRFEGAKARRLLDEKDVHGLWETFQCEDSGSEALRILYQQFSRQRVPIASVMVILNDRKLQQDDCQKRRNHSGASSLLK